IEGHVPASPEALLAIARSAAITAMTPTAKATKWHGYSWERFYAQTNSFDVIKSVIGAGCSVAPWESGHALYYYCHRSWTTAVLLGPKWPCRACSTESATVQRVCDGDGDGRQTTRHYRAA